MPPQNGTSVSPSEMCDERTASKLSAFNSTKRNGLSPANLINMAKLQDYWRYGLGSPGSEHSATLKLPKAPKSTSVHLPAPTLQNLLNPAPPNEEPEFLIADPYGVQALGAEEDDEEDGPVIICDSDLIRLKLKTLLTFRIPNSSHITWKIQLQNLQCLHCMHIAQP